MGIYTRSLTLLFILSLFIGTDAIAQKKKKKKKSKNKTEQVIQAPTLSNEIDSVSYALGMGMAQNLKTSGVDSLSLAVFNAGVNAIYAGDTTLINKEATQEYLQKYFTNLAASAGERNKAAGEAFLAKNKLRPEVESTESGIQYEVITAGEGDIPGPTDQVTVHYEGALLDGSVFDSSYKRGKEIQFGLNQVIPGWTEGLQLMNPGSKYILYIPYNLAYGEKGYGSDIPPYSTLVFTIELLGVEKAAE